MSRRLALVLVLIATLVAARSAGAYTFGDTLTLIWKPLPNLPAFARPGDVIPVWANAPSSATGWNGSLRLGVLTVPLSTASAAWQPTRGRWELSLAVPAGTPEELYDLSLGCATCVTDVAQHAVKVLPAFKSDFYFAQISDTHLPSHPFSSDGDFNTADTSGMADFSAVIDDLNLIRPEFVLHTGDLVNEGELDEYLAMHEMGRAQQMFTRLRDPIFVVTGNHDLGGWDATPPPDGTARKAWWRTFGWKFLENPPSGNIYHSQDYSFDYGLLHCIGLETYINNGPYDSYRTDLWGAQSFTAEQLSWLDQDLAAVPAGHSKLAFYHYDFGGTLANGGPGPSFSQIDPASLGLDGAIWGHNHGVSEGNRAARPFSLGCQAVIDGRRVFRIFRVSNGVITPGPMHRSGGSVSTPTESLTVTWSGPNNGTRVSLSATVNNRFGETWDHGQLVFYLRDQDSSFNAIGGTVTQTIRQGSVAFVYVDVSIPASTAINVSVTPAESAGVGDLQAILRFDPPSPNPFQPERGAMTLNFTNPTAGHVRLGVYDLGGRLVRVLIQGPRNEGTHFETWNATAADGQPIESGIYVVRLVTPAGEMRRKIAVVR